MSNFDLIAFNEMARIRAYFQSNDTEGAHRTLSKLRDNLDEGTFPSKNDSPSFRSSGEKLISPYLLFPRESRPYGLSARCEIHHKHVTQTRYIRL